jgi:hypothetical protein
MNLSGVGRKQLWLNFKVLSQHLPLVTEDCMYTFLTEKKVIIVCEACFAHVMNPLLLPLLVEASLALRRQELKSVLMFQSALCCC